MDIEKLVREYAPILHFHPEEGRHCCFPSDAERVFETFHKDWTLFREDKTPKSLDQSAPCYYETWVDGDLTQIRYWFWYNYNDFPGTRFGIGKHLGDWEHVELRLFSDRRSVWLLSNHESTRVATGHGGITHYYSEQPILERNHIHVWVALGSHAIYPSAASSPRCYARIFCDKIAEDGSIWHTEQCLKPLSETNFREFKGRWGDKKAPRSPLNECNNRWRNAPDIRLD
ncbi:MAG: hypothetical protein ACFFDV_03055 [Candidatus Thorarchaeota archaeon]